MIKTTDEYIKELAIMHGLPEFVVKEIVMSPFRFLKGTMEKKEFEGLMLPYLGKFIVPPKTKEYMTKYLNERNSKGRQEQNTGEERREGETA